MSINLQDYFLNQLRTQKIPVNVFLNTGYQLKGVITGFDAYIILLETSGRQNIVYKHGISTIMPLKIVQVERTIINDAQQEVLDGQIE